MGLSSDVVVNAKLVVLSVLELKQRVFESSPSASRADKENGGLVTCCFTCAERLLACFLAG